MILFIHRKDLRTEDLPALEWIRTQKKPSVHALILDPNILTQERITAASGIQFLKHVKRLRNKYRLSGIDLHIFYGNPDEVVTKLFEEWPIQQLVFHADYTPYAIARDRKLLQLANQHQVEVRIFDDLPLISVERFQKYVQKNEPYKVFTPFYRKWANFVEMDPAPVLPTKLTDLPLTIAHPMVYKENSELTPFLKLPVDWEQISDLDVEPLDRLTSFLNQKMTSYSTQRDFFAQDGTSGMSVHTNCGAISARTIYHEAIHYSVVIREAWVRQLAWRDFYLYQAMLSPDYFQFEKQFDLSELTDTHYEAWANGKTGIPIVDAAMNQLNQTGEMPNRLRMVTAMFLTKNLLCPFPLGETYFRLKLADADHILNRGGWLWSSSFGYDAAPYFRIMNPVSQSQRFDPNGNYIRRWLPQRKHMTAKQIHEPEINAIVDLTQSRAHAIAIYKKILGGSAKDE